MEQRQSIKTYKHIGIVMKRNKIKIENKSQKRTECYLKKGIFYVLGVCECSEEQAYLITKCKVPRLQQDTRNKQQAQQSRNSGWFFLRFLRNSYFLVTCQSRTIQVACRMIATFVSFGFTFRCGCYVQYILCNVVFSTWGLQNSRTRNTKCKASCLPCPDFVHIFLFLIFSK